MPPPGGSLDDPDFNNVYIEIAWPPAKRRDTMS